MATQWQSHVDIWQNQYNIVKLKNKIKYLKKKERERNLILNLYREGKNISSLFPPTT